MRCTGCSSYIPEGLALPLRCPQCGLVATTSPPKAEPTLAPVAPQLATTTAPESPPEVPEPKQKGAAAFAPYFTIQTRLTLELAHSTMAGATFRELNRGSISFGQDGFSVIWSEGRKWQKFMYRDIGPLHVVDGAIRILSKDTEFFLSFHAPKSLSNLLPGRLINEKQKRAALFVELLDKIKNGLKPNDILYYQKKFS